MSDVDSLSTDGQCLDGTTLLIVEDEVRFSRVLQRYLRLSGVSPIEALDGEQAIRILEEDEEHLIDAVLTDLKMPVVSGWELIAVLQECRPDLPLVAMSAFVPSPDLLGDVPLLSKPFLPEQLLVTLSPLVQRSQEVRRQARQQRADAAEVRSLAMYHTSVAEQERARSGNLRAALLSHRASQRQRT
jgi:two-component system, NtrC family, C4-dicarboxylate transport response regulator DctD